MKLYDEKNKSKEFIQDYFKLLELKDPKTGEVDILSKYKAIFDKSFFNVEEKITYEQEEISAELSKIAGYEIAPTPELDYSKAKIPSSQEEYKEAYERAKRAVETEFDKKFINIHNKEKINSPKNKTIITSQKTLLDNLNQIDPNIGKRLAGFNNVYKVETGVARAQSEFEGAQEVAQNQAEVLRAETLSFQSPENKNEIQQHGIGDLVKDLSTKSNSINQRLAKLGITPAPENQPRQDKPSPSPREPKASCLSGMFKAITNIKTPKFAKSIYQRLRSNSGDSKGGQGR